MKLSHRVFAIVWSIWVLVTNAWAYLVNGLLLPEHFPPGLSQVPGIENLDGLAPRDEWPRYFERCFGCLALKAKHGWHFPMCSFTWTAMWGQRRPVTHEIQHVFQAQMTNLIMASLESNLSIGSRWYQLQEGLIWFSRSGAPVQDTLLQYQAALLPFILTNFGRICILTPVVVRHSLSQSLYNYT